MLTDAFRPSNQGTKTLSVTSSSVTYAIPANGEYLEVQNSDATNIVFLESTFVNGGIAATVATGYPILPGQSKIIRRQPNTDAVAVISNATATFYVTAGVGT